MSKGQQEWLDRMTAQFTDVDTNFGKQIQARIAEMDPGQLSRFMDLLLKDAEELGDVVVGRDGLRRQQSLAFRIRGLIYG